MKRLVCYYILIAEVSTCTTLGPFFDEREADEEAKNWFLGVMAREPKRAQSIRSMLLCELFGDRLTANLYDPKFILEKILCKK